MSEQHGLNFPEDKDGFDAEAVLTNMLGLYSFQFEKHVKQIGDAKDLRRLLMAMMTKPTSGAALELETDVVQALKLAEDAKNEKLGALDEYEKAIRQLSTGQLRRLANAIVQYPLSNKEYISQDSNKTLLDAFAIGQKLNEAKQLYMQMSLMQYQVEEQQKQQQSVVATTEQTKTENGDSKNE